MKAYRRALHLAFAGSLLTGCSSDPIAQAHFGITLPGAAGAAGTTAAAAAPHHALDFTLANVASGNVITWAGSTAGKFPATGYDTIADAKFTAPAAIALDANGDFAYVADTGNHCVEAINMRTGEVNVVFGVSGTSGTSTNNRLNKPTSVVVDTSASGAPPAYMLVADSGNNRVLKVGMTGGTIESTLSPTAASNAVAPTAGATATVLYIGNKPGGLAEDASGDLFIADTGNHMIVEKVAASGSGATLTYNPGISQVYGSGTQGYAEGVGANASFNGPTGLAVSGTSLYVADTGNNVIRKLDTAGVAATTTLAGVKAGGYSVSGTAGATAKFKAPAGLAIDSTGAYLYVADSGNNAVRSVLTSGAHTVTSYVGGTLAATTAPKSGTTNGLALSGASLAAPGGLAIKGGSAGAVDLLIADTTNNRIRYRAH